MLDGLGGFDWDVHNVGHISRHGVTPMEVEEVKGESMPRKSRPDLKSEAEEAAWYATPEGRRRTRREFERALKSGTLLRSDGAKIPRTDVKVLAELMEQAKAKATRPISLRLPFADIERARKIAAKRGIGYQTVLKQAIRAGLNDDVVLFTSR